MDNMRFLCLILKHKISGDILEGTYVKKCLRCGTILRRYLKKRKKGGCYEQNKNKS